MLGHYRIEGMLGRGGMSVLYRAIDIRLGRRVALKVIGEHLTGDPEFRERFVEEARNTSAVDHPNVVPLYDFGEADGLLYIALRMVDGADLARLIAAGPLGPDRTLALLGQVADALDMLHGRGLVHLDVKPANVLVTTKEARGEHVYLADFGLTRRGATGHRTRGGDFLGSPTYAAPEHLRGEPVDARTDVYSLTCVLFACLTGRPPFRGEVRDVVGGHLTQPVPAATAMAALPPAIDEVLHRGMGKVRSQRYASCRELVAAAAVALRAGGPGRPAPAGRGHPQHPRRVDSEPVRLRPPSPAGSVAFSRNPTAPARRVARRRLWATLAGSVAVAAVVVVVVLMLGREGSDAMTCTACTHPRRVLNTALALEPVECQELAQSACSFKVGTVRLPGDAGQSSVAGTEPGRARVIHIRRTTPQWQS